jgi:hypothetical protein
VLLHVRVIGLVPGWVRLVIVDAMYPSKISMISPLLPFRPFQLHSSITRCDRGSVRTPNIFHRRFFVRAFRRFVRAFRRLLIEKVPPLLPEGLVFAKTSRAYLGCIIPENYRFDVYALACRGSSRPDCAIADDLGLDLCGMLIRFSLLGWRRFDAHTEYPIKSQGATF